MASLNTYTAIQAASAALLDGVKPATVLQAILQSGFSLEKADTMLRWANQMSKIKKAEGAVPVKKAV